MNSARRGGSAGFHSPYAHGLVRVAAVVPRVRVADPSFNAGRTIELAKRAAAAGSAITIFPELGLSAYSSDDLFHQDALLDASLAALEHVRAATSDIAAVLVVGAPVRAQQRVFNVAIVMCRGEILGVVPKSYLPNYREFYEDRYFAAARDSLSPSIRLGDASVPFGTDLLFECTTIDDLTLFVEVCEDAWVPISPGTYGSMAGATVVANLSASNVTVGKADYRRTLCASQSARTIGAYIYTAAGDGESTTDLAWDGQAIVCENGAVLAESERFAGEEQVVLADVDVGRLVADRLRMTSYRDNVHDHAAALRQMRRIPFQLQPEPAEGLMRVVERFPFVPADPVSRRERCADVYRIQVHGLASRLRATKVERVVIGVSGGLDSTHALIVAARTMDVLGLPRRNVLAYTMPGFATSSVTLENARTLMQVLGVCANEIDIKPAATQMLRDLEHPAARGEAKYDVTYENVQAGERTSHLFRLANQHDALVVGTGDLSELALGWCTYGVGDQMSHYNVNASVPKTLIQFLVRWVVSTGEMPEANDVLMRIVETVISPELVPGDATDAEPGQKSEDVVGPYELQDFFLYYVLRFGFLPSKAAFLALHAWGDQQQGAWPDLIPQERRHEYSLIEIKRWLGVFLQRFFEYSQFKRSAMPNGPKVGSGGSLSPRGDWRAPSDASAAAWLSELETVPDR